MKHTKVVVAWREGLHLRSAARLAQVATGFRSTIRLKCNGQVADLRSILSVVALCATMGTAILVEAAGADELEATAAIVQVFASAGDGDSVSGGS
ncbi:MAG: HPr family phosphocarrier protein [Opitutaceae bacterium]|nr:HPr family phosphocarrier protein [Opitutaceae bacterium]